MTPFQRRRNPYVNRMAEDMQIRNLAASTIDSYTWHVDKFCSHFGKMPDELGPEEIRQYQIFLVHSRARRRSPDLAETSTAGLPELAALRR